ncbi:unnamed protein product [Rotaria sp. Silwood2]|nr:unnamed protein product [Rotaria sp. Silwood2]CAF2871248.1 unnamed protein product [Rotaria sp. Silwood2]CAF3225005.1 unnamed protein product [Rotaria sp. Silwood2]CAF3367746.1 unnamed protein product [Rotaria sp. Silwood2]CAF3996317.1 unnamed protein product [Rotaria sp. Silwood2]
MSTRFILSLNTLPIEVIYHIFDKLNVQTIILSLYNVCKQLNTIINGYFHNARYQLNFDNISKADFIRVCQFIQPENIISLTLSDQSTTPGQISLFFSLFSIERFTQLCSLILLCIENEQLNFILEHSINFPLVLLSIQEKDNSHRSDTIDTLLSRMIERPGLQNLTVSLKRDGSDQIKWPISSTIQHLTLYHCNLSHFPIIFRHFSSLRTLFIKYCDMIDYEPIGFEIPFDPVPMYQLTSLIMEDFNFNMCKIKSFLSNTSSLTHLRLAGSINEIDFPWEQLIQTNLPLLNQFEFSFYMNIYDDDSSINNDTLIAPFRTPFWIKIKNWFVTCDQFIRDDDNNNNITKPNYDIHLYSIPIRNHYFHYYSQSIKTTSSTSMDINNDISVMDYVHTVYVNTDIMMATTTTNEVQLQTHRFRKASNLNIRTDNRWPVDFVQRVSSFIDLSHLEKLTLVDGLVEDFYPNTPIHFVNLLQQAFNVRSLVFKDKWLDKTCVSNMKNFCSLIPNHIKYLEIDISIMDDMKIILNRLDHLLSVTFRFISRKQHWPKKIIKWLSTRRDATYSTDLYTLSIWLGKKKKKKRKTCEQMTNDIKRIKTN